MRHAHHSVLTAAVVLAASNISLADVQNYTVTRISLSGGIYSNGGTETSTVTAINSTGVIIGTTNRYDTGSDGSDKDAWYYAPGSSGPVRIGLTGGVFSKPTGYASVSLNAKFSLNNVGYVVGTTNAYDATGTSLGATAWIYDPFTGTNGTTSQIIISALPTSLSYITSANKRSMSTYGASATGQAAGTATLYTSADVSAGTFGWYYDPTTKTASTIGLSDALHTSSTGTVSNSISGVSAAGQVLGSATAYNGSSILGSDIWYYNPNSTLGTQIIGLTGTDPVTNVTYTNTITGARSNSASLLSSTGQVAGTSYRYEGSTFVGTAAWVYTPGTGANAGSTTQIGLEMANGVGYSAASYRSTTDSSGVYSSTSMVVALNDAGQIVGTSNRYSGSSSLGKDAFLYTPGSGATLINVYTNAIYTQATTGSRSSTPSLLSAAGQVAGTVVRYNNSQSSYAAGQDVWYYDGSKATVIAPADSVYIGQTSYFGTSPATLVSNARSSTLSVINNTEMVAGYSTRYLLGTSTTVGQDAWVYDSTTDTTGSGVPFVISGLPGELSPDGFTESSTITALSDSGLAVGYYVKYNSDGSSVYEGFAWTEAGGALELNTLVDPTLPSSDWQSILRGLLISPNGAIVGYALPAGDSSTSQVAVLLTAVPEPASISLFAVSGVALLRRRRA